MGGYEGSKKAIKEGFRAGKSATVQAVKAIPKINREVAQLPEKIANSYTPTSTTEQVLATGAYTLGKAAYSGLTLPLELASETVTFAQDRKRENIPVFGPIGSTIGQTTAEFAENPTLENGARMAGAYSGGVLLAVGGAEVASVMRGASTSEAVAITVESRTASGAARRTYLNDKFGRTGNLNLDINIRGGKESATNFFRSQGVVEESIESYLIGIDFTKPVEVQTLGANKSLWQYQTPGAPQGNWYSLSPTVEPTELGISPSGFNRGTQTVDPKILNQYATKQPVDMLRSTAAAVEDTWSVDGNPYLATGGARQLFSNQKPAFVPTP